MRKFEGTVSMMLQGCKRTFSFEMDDEATDEEVNAEALEVMFNEIEWGYSEVDEFSKGE